MERHMKDRTICFTSSQIWKCLLSILLLHFLNLKEKINSVFSLPLPPLQLWTALRSGRGKGREKLSLFQRVWHRLWCLFFSKHPWITSCYWASVEFLICLESHSIVCFKNALRLPVSPVEALNTQWPFIYFQSFQIPSHFCDLGQGRGQHLNGRYSPFIIQ